MTTFHERLKHLRTTKKLTQAELAKNVGMSPSVIGMYEQNSRKPSVENLEVLADYFNVDMDYLMGRSNVTTRLINSDQLGLLEDNKNIYGDHVKNLEYFDGNPELLELYKDIYESESLQLLFDSAKDLSPEDLESVLIHIQGIRKARGLD